MTVKELIEALKEQPQDAQVLVSGSYKSTFGLLSEIRDGRNAATKGCVCLVGRGKR